MVSSAGLNAALCEIFPVVIYHPHDIGFHDQDPIQRFVVWLITLPCVFIYRKCIDSMYTCMYICMQRYVYIQRYVYMQRYALIEPFKRLTIPMGPYA